MTMNTSSQIGKVVKKINIKKKEKCLNRLGLALVIIISIGCVFFINVLSAAFDNSLTSKWLVIFSFSLIQDMLIAQPIKCFLIVGIIGFCGSSYKIKSGTDQCLRIFANFVAHNILVSTS